MKSNEYTNGTLMTMIFLTQSDGDVSDEFNRDNGVRLPVDVGECNWEGVVAELCLLRIIISARPKFLGPINSQSPVSRADIKLCVRSLLSRLPQ